MPYYGYKGGWTEQDANEAWVNDVRRGWEKTTEKAKDIKCLACGVTFPTFEEFDCHLLVLDEPRIGAFKCLPPQ
eukprot:g77799.t1